MLRSKNVWAILYGLFAQDYLLYLMLTWLPVYLVTERKMTLITAGFYAILPWVCASIGALLGGYLSDRMIKNGTSAIRARRRVMATGMIISLAIIPAAFVSDQLSAVLLIAASLGGMMFANGASWAIVSEIAPSGASGTLAGMQNFIGNIAGWIAPILTGFIATVTGSFISALVIAGLIGGAAALIYLVLLKERNEFTSEPATASSTEGALQ
jgi:ACS family glucarate transporter-like MFS transporter